MGLVVGSLFACQTSESSQTSGIDHDFGDEHERFGNDNIRSAIGLDATYFVDGLPIAA